MFDGRDALGTAAVVVWTSDPGHEARASREGQDRRPSEE